MRISNEQASRILKGMEAENMILVGLPPDAVRWKLRIRKYDFSSIRIRYADGTFKCHFLERVSATEMTPSNLTVGGINKRGSVP